MNQNAPIAHQNAPSRTSSAPKCTAPKFSFCAPKYTATRCLRTKMHRQRVVIITHHVLILSSPSIILGIMNTTFPSSPTASSPKSTKAKDETTYEDKKKLLMVLNIDIDCRDVLLLRKTLKEHYAQGRFSDFDLNRLTKANSTTMLKTFGLPRGTGKNRKVDNYCRRIVEYFNNNKVMTTVHSASQPIINQPPPPLYFDVDQLKKKGHFFGGNISKCFPTWYCSSFMLALQFLHQNIKKHGHSRLISGNQTEFFFEQKDEGYADIIKMLKHAIQPLLDNLELNIIELSSCESEPTNQPKKKIKCSPHVDSVNGIEYRLGFCLSEKTKKTLFYPLADDVMTSVCNSEAQFGGEECNELLLKKFTPMLEYKTANQVEKLLDGLEKQMVVGDYFCFASNVVHSAPRVGRDDGPRKIFWCSLQPKKNERAINEQFVHLQDWIEKKGGSALKKRKLWV